MFEIYKLTKGARINSMTWTSKVKHCEILFMIQGYTAGKGQPASCFLLLFDLSFAYQWRNVLNNNGTISRQLCTVLVVWYILYVCTWANVLLHVLPVYSLLPIDQPELGKCVCHRRWAHAVNSHGTQFYERKWNVWTVIGQPHTLLLQAVKLLCVVKVKRREIWNRFMIIKIMLNDNTVYD